MIRSKETRRRAVAVLQTLGVAAAYYASAQLGLLQEMAVHGSVVTPLWPPTGIALGALLCLGIRIWPAIALGALLTIVEMSGSLSLYGAGIAAGNTLAPLFSFLALRRIGFRVELDRLRDGVALVFLGALLGMLISATVGAGALMLSDKLPLSRFWLVWSAWWVGDAMGVLVVTPVLLVLRRARPTRPTGRWAEAVLLAVIAVTATAVATRGPFSMIYLVFPVIIWAALRFQLPGSAPCALLVSVFAVVGGRDGAGPFEDHSVLEVMVNLAILNGCVALTALLLAAIVTEHQNIRRETELACEELAALVEQLAPLPPVPRPGTGTGPRDEVG
ncbi:MASE1 domain-containing protein [Streptomyces fulvorobeus]|uniref:Integral membrane sensor domain MASE1 n=1 Tax=Streptomyces fulvorobeus TaxID=284028 RepID=A0A7J0CET1_9ACTN|nr:MASE1 domain-containing protein [Streptomyces fulvorobeus]NYE44469.1 integral membrane sensor domain MASE1 [Streptomyces fulvorobeus]GFN01002.1 membrane protein [Streptomyces fulvorobeus]